MQKAAIDPTGPGPSWDGRLSVNLLVTLPRPELPAVCSCLRHNLGVQGGAAACRPGSRKQGCRGEGSLAVGQPCSSAALPAAPWPLQRGGRGDEDTGSREAERLGGVGRSGGQNMLTVPEAVWNAGSWYLRAWRDLGQKGEVLDAWGPRCMSLRVPLFLQGLWAARHDQLLPARGQPSLPQPRQETQMDVQWGAGSAAGARLHPSLRGCPCSSGRCVLSVRPPLPFTCST